ncbi:hypothetical protein [Helicobacter ganmani]|uniref:hypothetical protein n=1 Tax=Helicobacter ganmani TaxID=60246 RepID=UPI003A8C6116
MQLSQQSIIPYKLTFTMEFKKRDSVLQIASSPNKYKIIPKFPIFKQSLLLGIINFYFQTKGISNAMESL